MSEPTLPRLGLLASSFDPLHAGTVWAMQQAIEAGVCDGIIAALHIDPSVERQHKAKPVSTVEERTVLLRALRYVVTVEPYMTERELLALLQRLNPCVRIQGDDYKGKRFTGDNLGIQVFYAARRPEWSATEFRRRMVEGWKNV